MSLSSLPLSYCTNLHPGLSVAEVRHGLRQFTMPTQARFGDLAAGLWLARPVISELLAAPSLLQELREELHRGRLSCYTLNTFPFGNFHSARVKEQVYLPDWSTEERAQYTCDCADVLAALMPSDMTEGSLSTVPLGFKPFNQGPDFFDRCAERLIGVARHLAALQARTGKTIRLAIEPEPFCVIETTPEAIAFFQHLRAVAVREKARSEVQEFIGLCYDVCHQSVEFEDVSASILALAAADIRINKVHITCAIRCERPAVNIEGRQKLATYAEPRYLHQTLARQTDGAIARCVDLTSDLALSPPAEFATADEWRIHFHVPVNAERLGPLHTTRDDLRTALTTVKTLSYAPHLEVETYTWDVLPDGGKVDLVDGLVGELAATRELLRQIAT